MCPVTCATGQSSLTLFAVYAPNPLLILVLSAAHNSSGKGFFFAPIECLSFGVDVVGDIGLVEFISNCLSRGSQKFRSVKVWLDLLAPIRQRDV
jgi:hypothetical protein